VKEPSYEDKQKLFKLRCRSKRGDHISAEELEWCRLMLKKYPEHYRSIEKDVYEATKPYGAR